MQTLRFSAAYFAATALWCAACTPKEPLAAEPASVPRPVILLTGFEPFGSEPVNSSWQAVRAFDGMEWNGYLLRARQIPVLWGAPMAALDRAIGELDPVAVFSFGQGSPDAFEVEAVARNHRAAYKDNQGRLPPAPTMVAGGPAEYRASADTARIAAALAAQAYPATQSRDAGSYLCEETLYTLEHLKATKHPDVYVMFCHVPIFGRTLPGSRQVVDGDYLRGFVGDVLAAWISDQSPVTSDR